MIVSLLVEKHQTTLLRDLVWALCSHYETDRVSTKSRIGFRTNWHTESRGTVETVAAIELGVELAAGEPWKVEKLSGSVKKIMRDHGLRALSISFGRYIEELII